MHRKYTAQCRKHASVCRTGHRAINHPDTDTWGHACTFWDTEGRQGAWLQNLIDGRHGSKNGTAQHSTARHGTVRYATGRTIDKKANPRTRQDRTIHSIPQPSAVLRSIVRSFVPTVGTGTVRELMVTEAYLYRVANKGSGNRKIAVNIPRHQPTPASSTAAIISTFSNTPLPPSLPHHHQQHLARDPTRLDLRLAMHLQTHQDNTTIKKRRMMLYLHVVPSLCATRLERYDTGHVMLYV